MRQTAILILGDVLGIFVCSFLLVKYWNEYYTDPCHFVLLAVLEVSPELRKYSA